MPGMEPKPLDYTTPSPKRRQPFSIINVITLLILLLFALWLLGVLIESYHVIDL